MRIKDSKFRYVIVNAYYYARYRKQAYIEAQAQTNDYNEAEYIKDSFERNDNLPYLIVDTQGEKK